MLIALYPVFTYKMNTQCLFWSRKYFKYYIEKAPTSSIFAVSIKIYCQRVSLRENRVIK